jgi:hypothetical protein
MSEMTSFFRCNRDGNLAYSVFVFDVYWLFFGRTNIIIYSTLCISQFYDTVSKTIIKYLEFWQKNLQFQKLYVFRANLSIK